MAELFHTLTVCAVEPLTDDAVQVSFHIPPVLRETFLFTPGQYLTLRSQIDGADIRRAYSICTTPNDSGHDNKIGVGIRAVDDGRFSGFANQRLQVGDTIDVMPPQGRFTLPGTTPDATGHILAIAAGSGITPILSIVRTLLETTSTNFITLVYGNRWTNTIMFRSLLNDLKDRYLDRFRLIHCMSRESQDIELLNGRVDAQKILELAECELITPANCDHIMICGPAEMADAVTSTCVSLGAAAERVKSERFTPADDVVTKAPSSDVKKVVKQGVEVTVIIDGSERRFTHTDPQQSLLDAAQTAGIELPFSCAGGMCATCRCKLIRGKGEMSVNYSLEPWELEAGFTLACQTRPTSASITIDFDAV